MLMIIAGDGLALRRTVGAWLAKQTDLSQAEITLAVNQSYGVILLAGAGMLRQKWIAANKHPAQFDRFVGDALAYLQSSWGDEHDEAEHRADVVREDLIAALGELMAKD
jgi:hypothetical protein